jgi:hypothetical protein
MSEKQLDIQHATEDDNTLAASRQGYGLTICLDWNRMLVHRKTIRALGHPERVRLLINPVTRHFCIQGCDEKEPCSFEVPRDLSSYQDSFYIHSKFLLGQLCALMAWNPQLSYRVFGKINTQTNVLDFDLNRHIEVNLNEFLENDEVPEEFMKDYHGQPASAQQETLAVRPAASQVPGPAPAPTTGPAVPASRGFMGSLYDSVQLLMKKDEER